MILVITFFLCYSVSCFGQTFYGSFYFFLDDDDDVHRCRRRHRRWRYGVRWCSNKNIQHRTTYRLHSHVFRLSPISTEAYFYFFFFFTKFKSICSMFIHIYTTSLSPSTALLSATVMHVYLLSFIGWLLLLWFVGRLAIGDSFSLRCGAVKWLLVLVSTCKLEIARIEPSSNERIAENVLWHFAQCIPNIFGFSFERDKNFFWYFA